MVEQQLVILLRIVVGLVVIEMQCTSFVREVMLLAVVVFYNILCCIHGRPGRWRT